MSIEDILRAAQKVNGIPDNVSKSTKKNTPPPPERNRCGCFFKIIAVFIFIMILASLNDNAINKSTKYNSSSSYEIGYLKGGSSWMDSNVNSHYNSKKVKVEIWNEQLVMSDGSKLTQIFFLEGDWAGVWGYTLEEFLIRKK